MITVVEEPHEYGRRRLCEPLPDSYWDRIQRPLCSPHLESSLRLLDEAMWASPAHGRALIQQAMGAIRQDQTAKALGLTVAQLLLTQADEVIE